MLLLALGPLFTVVVVVVAVAIATGNNEDDDDDVNDDPDDVDDGVVVAVVVVGAIINDAVKRREDISRGLMTIPNKKTPTRTRLSRGTRQRFWGEGRLVRLIRLLIREAGK